MVDPTPFPGSDAAMVLRGLTVAYAEGRVLKARMRALSKGR